MLVHTHGGDANTSYRIIQLIRSYCKNLNILVPTHAHSGGTLIAFGGDVVEMGRSATLSPIDVQLEAAGKSFALLSVEKYIEFLEDSCNVCSIKDEKNKTHFVTELTKKLIEEEVSPSELGELFRLRGLTELHAKTLLQNYMFANNSHKEAISDRIFSKFTKESPTHSFEMDFELVKESGLQVERMDNNIYIQLRSLINILNRLKRNGIICPFYPGSTKQRQPFFKVFDFGEKKR